MALIHRPLIVNRGLAASLRDIQTRSVKDEAARQALGALLQSALQLEFATIPTYLSASFSLLPDNRKIAELILRAAVEEMLHMTAVANLMNAIGIAPGIAAAVPRYPYQLTVVDPPLQLDLCSFSLKLVEKLFMQIETPESPVVFPSVAATGRKTIGQFYQDIIEIIQLDTIPDLFKDAGRDAYKQVTPKPNFRPIAYASNQDTGRYPLKADIDFKIIDKASAVRHLSWIIDQGEGSAPFEPLTAEGLPGHYYRFESILRSRFLVKNETPPLFHAFSGGDLPFVPTAVHEFDPNAKVADYAAFPDVQARMKRFNVIYTAMIGLLEQAFNCPTPEQQAEAVAAYEEALFSMQQLPNYATGIIQEAKQHNIKGGIPFEYTPPLTS